ncbi:uncharacterized protein cd34 [Pseudochaenichthys georgianus]|uniref:uncharacterized protein cd34 n=1 Tax=Pseudochaenichthys georgianus TaxID=52239 RepID=UPI001469EB0E|nr:uncharacterized protein LOC117442344 [Pseudochaenichthys georgianus]
MAMWRMTLLLGALLLSCEVKCEDATTEAPIVTTVINTATPAEAPAASTSPVSGDAITVAADGKTLPTAALGDQTFPATIISVDAVDKVPSGATSGPLRPRRNEEHHPGRRTQTRGGRWCRVWRVSGKEDISESNAVKVFLSTTDCETTKRIIQENPAGWCRKDNCDLKIFQEGNTALVSSEDADLATLADALKSEHLKEKLGVTKIETPSSSGSSVFVGILVSGLLAAVAITVGYLKCPRRTSGKGVRLAEEAFPADQENQGNTLASEAPLNPPQETPEKPSINGETPEAEKPDQPPPPTNGHTTTKTADTEL